MIINVIRQKFLADRTIGEMFVDGKHFCYTLEDPVRGDGIKIQDETAIPAGVYYCAVTYSPRFKRDMVEVQNVPMFTGIRCHGGNTPEDSSGCILCAFNLVGDKIQGTAEKDLTAKVRAARESDEDVLMVVTNFTAFKQKN